MNGNYQRLVEDESGSLFFKRFMEGLRSRMGQITKPNVALSTPLLLELVTRANQQFEDSDNTQDSHLWSSFLTYAIVSYTVSLRGPEGFLLDLAGLIKHWDTSDEYLIIPLIGRLKGERHDLTHLIPCAKTTNSGINLYFLLRRHIDLKISNHLSTGPAISDYRGRVLTSKVVDDMLHTTLTYIFHDHPKLFPPFIDSVEKFQSSYQCFRTFRRSSTTRATEMNVSSVDINVINRWQTTDDSKTKKPNLGMHHHYTELSLLVRPFLRYTSQM